MNVGPTFENPSTASDNNTQPPRLTCWISKNPHPPGNNPDGTPVDNAPREDYKKTLFWNIPPKLLKGTIIQKVPVGGAPPEIIFKGTFWTPSSPNGKDASKLNDTEKDNFLALLRDEINAVEARYAYLKEHKLIAMVAPNGPSAAVMLAVKLTAPSHVTVGSAVALKFTAEIAPGVAASIAHINWFLSDGRRFVGEQPPIRFGKVGTYTIGVRVRDSWGAEGRATLKIVVDKLPADR